MTISLILAAAGVVEWLAGGRVVRQPLPHPVVLIGWVIAALDRALNWDHESTGRRRITGVLATAVLVAGALALGWMLAGLLARLPLGGATVVEILVCATLLAPGSLDVHVRAVARGLETGGLEGGRAAVAMIVGRDPASLDEAGVARAAVESLAENASDGVVAPALWFLLLGLPGLFAYKVINTADSMIGHRTPRHEAFGWAAARLDDLVNLPASRLTGLLFLAACPFLPGADARAGWIAMRRDAPRHRSPNAGWPEAAVAGALGYRLGGPRRYAGRLVADAWMGSGRADLGAADIRRALALWRAMLILVLAGLVVAGTTAFGIG